MASARSRLVAEISRTLTLVGSLVPTRTISPVSSTRSSFTWIEMGMSPISSRNSVPPLAYWNRPIRSRSAPVNAPLTWPNSSLSSTFSLSSAQLSGTNGLFLRGLLMCRALATSSLPVPLSPVIRTEAEVGAIWRSLAMTRVHRRRAADRPLRSRTSR